MNSTKEQIGSHTAEANVRLMAAAADLLAALRELVPPIPDITAPCHAGRTTREDCGQCGRIMRAHAAIAKATGR